MKKIILLIAFIASFSQQAFAQLVVNGELKNACMENRSSEPASAGCSGQFHYNSVTDKGILRYASTWDSLVTEDKNQTLTNKTLTSPTISGGTITTPLIDNYVEMNHETTPSNPAAGKIRFYPKSDNKMYVLDSSGVEQPLGSGSGSGVPTFFYDDLENGSASNFTTYDDGASATPVDGTGGSPSTLTVTASNSSPLRGSFSLSLAKSAANGQGEGIAASVAIPSGYQQGAKRIIEFLWDGSGSNYAAGDVVAYIYDVTNATLITPSVTSMPAAKTPMQFTWDSTASGSYRLIFHVATTNATAWTVKADDITVGPGQVIPVPAVGEISFSPTVNGFGTTTEGKFTGYRDSNFLVVQGFFRAGTVAASTASISLPSGLTIDSTEVTSTSVGQDIGRYSRVISGAATDIFGSTPLSGVMFVDRSVSNSLVYFAKQTGSNVYTKINGSDVCNSSDRVNVNFRIPIAEWAGAPNYAGSSDVEYAYNTQGTPNTSDTTSFAYGPAGTPILSHTSGTSLDVQFQKRIQVTDQILLQVSSDSGATWNPVESNTGGSIGFVRQGSASYGMYWEALSSNKIRVWWNSTARPTNASYAGAGQAWSSFTTYRWRVVKGSAAALAGISLATPTSSGLVKMNTGATTNNVGEYETWSGTATLSGGYSVNPTGTVYITRIGRRVWLWAGEISGTSNATTNIQFTFSDSGNNIPTRFAPSTSQLVSGGGTILDNSAASSTFSYQVTGSVITFAKSLGGGAASFTASGLKGYYYSHISWEIR